jgi:hypothetical protein
VNSKVEEGGKMSGRCKKFEKHGRMSRAGGDRGNEESRDADQIRSQFSIIIEKHHIENISRTESVVVGRN